MYVPPKHRLEDTADRHALIEQHPLGAWVFPGPQGLQAHHLPFFLDRRGPLGTLVGHVARANPVWRDLAPDRPSVVLFQGPQSYVTPGWYPGKAEHGRVVPTWNYVAVHAHGVARALHGRDELLQLLNRLTDTQEGTRPKPWRVADAPADHVERLLKAIVGVEIPIERLEGRLKASQDEDLADRHGTVLGLRAQGTPQSLALADLVQQAITRDGG